MADTQECPVCERAMARRHRGANRDVLCITCHECGSFRMSAVFASRVSHGWQSIPDEKRQDIAQFLQSTKELREALPAEFLVLGFDTWRVYVQDGQNSLRRAAPYVEGGTSLWLETTP